QSIAYVHLHYLSHANFFFFGYLEDWIPTGIVFVLDERRVKSQWPTPVLFISASFGSGTKKKEKEKEAKSWTKCP
ncbi:hypothetical protein QBC45DRAFT_298374, partial [Copromyces sp. CBS 386.78]